jgi:hypothetical protein
MSGCCGKGPYSDGVPAPRTLIAEARKVKRDVRMGDWHERDIMIAWNAVVGLTHDLANALESALVARRPAR